MPFLKKSMDFFDFFPFFYGFFQTIIHKEEGLPAKRKKPRQKGRETPRKGLPEE